MTKDKKQARFETEDQEAAHADWTEALEKTARTLMDLLKEEAVVRDAVKEARKAEAVAFESAQAAGAVPGGL